MPRTGDGPGFTWERLLDTRSEWNELLLIGHPYPETVAALEEMIPRFQSRGIEFVPLSALVESRQGPRTSGLDGNKTRTGHHERKIRNAAMLAIALIALMGPVAPAEAQDTGTGKSSGEAPYHYSLGTKLMLDGKLSEAAKEYEKALSLTRSRPSSPRS